MFSRPCKFKEVNNFHLCLGKEKVQTGVEDKMLWNEGTWAVSCKSLLKELEPAPPVSFLANTIWHPNIQPRICFFAWEAAWGKALTLDNLEREEGFWQRGAFCVEVKKKPHILSFSTLS